MRRKTPPARIIVAASEHDADMLYATRFFAPDAFLFLEQNGRRVILLNDLEIDRGKKDAQVDEVIAYSEFSKPLKEAAGGKEPRLPEVLIAFLKKRKVRRATAPFSFPLGLARQFAAAGIEVTPEEGLFWKERARKSEEELRLLRRALEITERGMARAMEVLAASSFRKNRQLRWANRPLTSEALRAEIDSAILRAGGQPANTIVAGGEQACDPHERGSGPLRAGELIIIDIFPRDARSGYFGDLTRTVVRGAARDAQRQLWETVREGQKLALSAMRPRASGRKIHEAVKKLFTDRGYPTEQRDGRWVGFFHGTGHGLGLEVHEEPRFSATTFRAGQVLTVEPGLYYPGLGGVRLEDVAAITATGVQLLSQFPKQLEV